MRIIFTILLSISFLTCFSQTNKTDTIIKRKELRHFQNDFYMRCEIIGKDSVRIYQILTQKDLEQMEKDSLEKLLKKQIDK